MLSGARPCRDARRAFTTAGYLASSTHAPLAVAAGLEQSFSGLRDHLSKNRACYSMSKLVQAFLSGYRIALRISIASAYSFSLIAAWSVCPGLGRMGQVISGMSFSCLSI